MERDVQLKAYLSDNARYADLVNGFGFAGRQVVQADMLSDLDTQTGIYQLPVLKKKKRKPKYRDLIRKAAFGLNFAVIGVENQDEVNYLMPGYLRPICGRYLILSAALRRSRSCVNWWGRMRHIRKWTRMPMM